MGKKIFTILRQKKKQNLWAILRNTYVNHFEDGPYAQEQIVFRDFLYLWWLICLAKPNHLGNLV